ncbi:MAG: pyrophosphate--fructose-6-phosphate 1-phosphotransferase, partial [bacterium]
WDPPQVAAYQLVKDGCDVLHTIGGDDTNTAAADLAAYLAGNHYGLTVVGLPKTIDNDVYPVRQSLGAWTAAEEGALYFANIVKENTANARMLIIHEVMGRNCGWLTAATAVAYRKRMEGFRYLPAFGLTRDREDVHAVYVPEMAFDVKAEAARLYDVMDKNDCVNIFISEGACVEAIIAERVAKGEEVSRDAFGHPRLDKVNVGGWFAKQFGEMLGAEKTLVQKSGYYSRAAAPSAKDKELIQACAKKAVECALAGVSGVVGEDENKNGELRACEFARIKGGKPFDIDTPWFNALLASIGQPKGARVAVKH